MRATDDSRSNCGGRAADAEADAVDANGACKKRDEEALDANPNDGPDAGCSTAGGSDAASDGTNTPLPASS